MRNKLKIAAIVVAVITGMVLYKSHWEKQQKKDKKDDHKDGFELAAEKRGKSHKHNWN